MLLLGNRPDTEGPEISQLYTITELEEKSGVVRRTIHYYVKEGLLPPPKGRGPSARYTEDHLLKLRYIQLMKESTHLRLEGIREAVEPLTGDELEAEVLRMRLWSQGGDTPTKQLLAGLDRSPAGFDARFTAGLDTSPAKVDAESTAGLDMSMAETDAEAAEGLDEAVLMESTSCLERAPTETDPRRRLIEASGAPDSGGDPESNEMIRPELELRMSPENLLHKLKRYMSKPPETAPPEAEPLAAETEDTWARVRITDDLEIHFRPGAGGGFHKKLRRLLAMARKSFGK